MKKVLFTVIIAAVLLFSCSGNDIKIALSKGKGSEHYEQYEKWLKEFNTDIEFIDLYHIEMKEAIKILKECDGIVLTGGPDVEPSRYGRPSEASRCEIDMKRDSLEFEVIKIAEQMKLPMLAICRGEQILNVAHGGSLIVDILSDFDKIIKHKCPDPANCFHKVMVSDNTLLSKLTKTSIGEVNSNHHQGVDRLADDFAASAFSQDGLIEAYEWANPSGKPFMLAVQWHPERLGNANKLSYSIGKNFIDEVVKQKLFAQSR